MIINRKLNKFTNEIRIQKLILKIVLYPLPLWALVYYYQIDIEQKGSIIPPCIFKKLTGYSCSGCGAQRALHSVLHGNFVEAFRYNILFVLLIPFLILLYYQIVQTYFLKKKGFTGILFSTRTGILILVVSIVFMIIRNLPFMRDFLSV